MNGSATPNSIEQIQELVRDSAHIRVSAGGTKSGLSADANISLRELSGILDYNPSEYTFTALAATPLAEIHQALSEHQQFMPFDPPFVSTGGTIGGTVAAGLSGPGRFRFGGVRDFFLGVRLVTGSGRVVFGGGKVVKNAAGFDFPKLLVGSLGSLGIMTELTFKVFPRPTEYRTVRILTPDHQTAVEAMVRLSMAQVELYCLDYVPGEGLMVRAGGLPTALSDRVERVQSIAAAEAVVLDGDQEPQYWEDVREFRWVAADRHLVKLPITPANIPALEAFLTRQSLDVPRRYSVAGNVVWLAWPAASLNELSTLTEELQRPAIVLTGSCATPLVDPRPASPLLDRINSVFDPDKKLRP